MYIIYFIIALKHRYSFIKDLSDSIGGSSWDGTLYNGARISNGSLVLDQTSTYKNYTTGGHARLPKGVLGSFTKLSLEMWVDIGLNNINWCKLLQFGDPVNNCPSIQCYRYRTTGRICCKLCSAPSNVELCTNQMFNGTKTHLIFAIDSDGVVSIFINGLKINSKPSTIPIPGKGTNDLFLLGAAPVLTDYTLWGSIKEFRIWSGVYGQTEAKNSYQIGPDYYRNSKLFNILFLIYSYNYFLELIFHYSQTTSIQQSFITIPSKTLDVYDILTVEWWVSFDESSTQDKLFYFGINSTSSYSNPKTVSPSSQCYWSFNSGSNNRTLCCSVSSTSDLNEICSFTEFSPSVKNHVVIIFNPIDAEMKIYVNGSLSVSNKLRMGVPGRGNNDLLYFNSNLREFRIWGGYLSELELYSHYVNGPNSNIGKFISFSYLFSYLFYLIFII